MTEEYAKTRRVRGGEERVRKVGNVYVVLGFSWSGSNNGNAFAPNLVGTGVTVYLYEEIGGGREYLYNETFGSYRSSKTADKAARAHIRAKRLRNWQRGAVERERARVVA